MTFLHMTNSNPHYLNTSCELPLHKPACCVKSVKNSRITSIKSPSVCMTTLSASLTILTSLLLQSRDISCYVSRPILAPPPLRLQKHADLRAHYFAQSPDLWHQPRLADITCAWSWRLCGINPAVQKVSCSLSCHDLSRRVQVFYAIKRGGRTQYKRDTA